MIHRLFDTNLRLIIYIQATEEEETKNIYAILGPFWIFQSSSVNIDLLELSSDQEQET